MENAVVEAEAEEDVEEPSAARRSIELLNSSNGDVEEEFEQEESSKVRQVLVNQRRVVRPVEAKAAVRKVALMRDVVAFILDLRKPQVVRACTNDDHGEKQKPTLQLQQEHIAKIRHFSDARHMTCHVQLAFFFFFLFFPFYFSFRASRFFRAQSPRPHHLRCSSRRNDCNPTYVQASLAQQAKD